MRSILHGKHEIYVFKPIMGARVIVLGHVGLNPGLLPLLAALHTPLKYVHWRHRCDLCVSTMAALSIGHASEMMYIQLSYAYGMARPGCITILRCLSLSFGCIRPYRIKTTSALFLRRPCPYLVELYGKGCVILNPHCRLVCVLSEHGREGRSVQRDFAPQLLI